MFILGTPVQQGSTKSFRHKTTGKIITLSDNRDDLLPWRKTIAAAVRREIGPGIQHPRPEPVRLSLGFIMPRHTTERKTFTRPHTRKPDVDKLIRAVLDALTKVLYEDDSQVIGFRDVYKRTAEPGEAAGLWLTWQTN